MERRSFIGAAIALLLTPIVGNRKTTQNRTMAETCPPSFWSRDQQIICVDFERGDDTTGDGSVEKPFATLAAAPSVKSGDVMVFSGRLYAGSDKILTVRAVRS